MDEMTQGRMKDSEHVRIIVEALKEIQARRYNQVNAMMGAKQETGALVLQQIVNDVPDKSVLVPVLITMVIDLQQQVRWLTQSVQDLNSVREEVNLLSELAIANFTTVPKSET